MKRYRLMKRIMFIILLCSALPLQADEISETDAVLLLLKYNPEIQNALIDTEIAFSDKKLAMSQFNPVLNVGTSRIFGEDFMQTMTISSLDKMFSSGMTISVSAGLSDMLYDSPLPSERNTASVVTIRQSLLRNAFGRATFRVRQMSDLGIDIARIGADILKEEIFF